MSICIHSMLSLKLMGEELGIHILCIAMPL